MANVSEIEIYVNTVLARENRRLIAELALANAQVAAVWGVLANYGPETTGELRLRNHLREQLERAGDQAAEAFPLEDSGPRSSEPAHLSSLADDLASREGMYFTATMMKKYATDWGADRAAKLDALTEATYQREQRDLNAQVAESLRRERDAKNAEIHRLRQALEDEYRNTPEASNRAFVFERQQATAREELRVLRGIAQDTEGWAALFPTASNDALFLEAYIKELRAMLDGAINARNRAEDEAVRIRMVGDQALKALTETKIRLDLWPVSIAVYDGEGFVRKYIVETDAVNSLMAMVSVIATAISAMRAELAPEK